MTWRFPTISVDGHTIIEYGIDQRMWHEAQPDPDLRTSREIPLLRETVEAIIPLAQRFLDTASDDLVDLLHKTGGAGLCEQISSAFVRYMERHGYTGTVVAFNLGRSASRDPHGVPRHYPYPPADRPEAPHQVAALTRHGMARIVYVDLTALQYERYWKSPDARCYVPQGTFYRIEVWETLVESVDAPEGNR